jgi:hypothetical protein
MATESSPHSTTGIILNKLHDSLKLLILRPKYIPMQQAVILNTCRIVQKVLAE